MEGIVAIIVQAVAGMVGGGIAGQMVKTVGMAVLPKLLAGAVGGVAGGSLLGAVFGTGTVDPVSTGGLDVAQLLVQVVGGLVGGGALTGIAGKVLGKG